MEVREYVRQLFESIGEHPRRIIASSLGVFWGAAAIIVMLAWGSGFHSYMYDELQRYGRPMLFVLPGVTSSGFPGFRPGVRVRISREDVSVAEISNAHVVSAVFAEHRSLSDERALVRAENRIRRMDLSGVDHRFAEYRNFRVGTGRFFEEQDVERQRAVAVLGYEAAEELFGSASAAIARRIRIEGRPFTVIGVADRKGRQYNNTNRPDNRLLMVPVSTAEARLGFSAEDVEWLSIFPKPGVSGEEALRAVVATIAGRAGFHPDDTDAVRWFDTTKLLRMIDLMHAGFLVFIGIAGTITLLVAGVGIANFQLATLAERTAEIGVCKALGARNRTLMAQTILESLAVSGGTALLGLGFGLAACALLDAVTPPGILPTPVISAPAVAITTAALVGVAITAATVPALRVRKMEIAAALRAEI
jgi:putative ABC transport system permease protein